MNNAGEIRPGAHAYELMRGIGNLCIGRDSDPRYDPRRLVELLLQGLQRPSHPDVAGQPVCGVGPGCREAAASAAGGGPSDWSCRSAGR